MAPRGENMSNRVEYGRIYHADIMYLSCVIGNAEIT